MTYGQRPHVVIVARVNITNAMDMIVLVQEVVIPEYLVTNKDDPNYFLGVKSHGRPI
jgi:hypothetical protein